LSTTIYPLSIESRKSSLWVLARNAIDQDNNPAAVYQATALLYSASALTSKVAEIAGIGA
jgi:hypothetical protein